jgi:hypothetical protein
MHIYIIKKYNFELGVTQIINVSALEHLTEGQVMREIEGERKIVGE